MVSPGFDPLALLEGLLRIYSPSGEEGEAVEWLVEQMAALGFDASMDEVGNAIGVMGEGMKEIVLLGHVDTVEGFIPVHREGDRLYGRGAVDAKGPLAAFIAAAAQVGPLPDQRLVVIGAVEEEAATSKGARYAMTRFAPQWAIVGEPSGWEGITLGYKGRLLIRYRLEQPMAHTSGRGRSAPEEALLFWQAVVTLSEAINEVEERCKPFDQVRPSLRAINTTSDGLQERVEMIIGIRVPSGVAIEKLEQDIQGMVGHPHATVSFSGQEQAFRAEKNTPLVRAFLRAIRQEGGQPRFKLKTGTSDMNVVGLVWRCPIVAYGPGDSALDHTPDEHLDLMEYHKAVAVLRRVLRQL